MHITNALIQACNLDSQEEEDSKHVAPSLNYTKPQGFHHWEGTLQGGLKSLCLQGTFSPCWKAICFILMSLGGCWSLRGVFIWIWKSLLSKGPLCFPLVGMSKWYINTPYYSFISQQICQKQRHPHHDNAVYGKLNKKKKNSSLITGII